MEDNAEYTRKKTMKEMRISMQKYYIRNDKGQYLRVGGKQGVVQTFTVGFTDNYDEATPYSDKECAQFIANEHGCQVITAGTAEHGQ